VALVYSIPELLNVFEVLAQHVHTTLYICNTLGYKPSMFELGI